MSVFRICAMGALLFGHGLLVLASPFQSRDATNTSEIEAPSANPRGYTFENLIPTGIGSVQYGPDPDIIYIAAQIIPYTTPTDPADMRSISISFAGPAADEASMISNTARENPTYWYPPRSLQLPRDTTTGEIRRPATFKWSSLHMKLSDAINVARQAGYPGPWRKATIAYVTGNMPIFDRPGPDEIVFNLKSRNRIAGSEVIVGSVSRRVRYRLQAESSNNGTTTVDPLQVS